MPVSFSTLLPNRIRRDEARVRRQGTGRVTTKRTFSLNVFKGSQLGQFGRKTGLPLSLSQTTRPGTRPAGLSGHRTCV